MPTSAQSVLAVALILLAAVVAQALQHPLPDERIYASDPWKPARGDPLGAGGFESSFRTINRRSLLNCFDLNPYVNMTVDTAGPLSDTQNVTVSISGVVNPSDHDWLGVVSPSNASTSNCPDVAVLILATGDTSELPLLCHYPVKFKLLKEDPGYLSCASSQCQVPGLFGSCLVKTCSASITFRLINIRTDIMFVLFTGGLQVPCVVDKAGPLPFANPKAPLYGHISSIDSTGTSMRLTWISGDAAPQTVQYADGSTATSTVGTFTKSNMCEPSAASDFGWHDPGFIHTAVMTGLSPSTQYSYQYGSQAVGLSPSTNFSTPPAAGDDAVTLIIFGDMGKAERDGSSIHYIQPGSISVIDAITTAVSGANVDFVFHIGDISYATGFLVEWDNFLELIQPIASRVPYMTAIGNHERDHPLSGSYYSGTDSGGECGILYYNYFQMPTPAQDKPWYSLESGPIHFTVVSTEHDWKAGSEQYMWIQADLASVNRTRTPWVVYTGHRPMYSSYDSVLNAILPAVDTEYTDAIEPLLLAGKVDLVLAGHVHNYERLCAVYQGKCLVNSTKDTTGLDTYNFTTYAAPVQAVIGMSGFQLDGFKSQVDVWSKVRISEYGYVGIQATRQKLLFEFMFVNMTVGDSFAIVK
ncbi:acid phosphatase type 7 [Marchantia polymorpha subsp. ruderalis]|uniref:Purple acid phosphatase n=2 Tax=Marchantia polymorpha TaxID=3197 RepID=A0A176VGE7_MARPO|nr:hypothetical protein AXG93_1040s1260 [Marchantia polymorpha subsp. ruderalis]PTQ45647.1 hypothetical protein MARPO_0014s0160 [Marchantia polymorpha]BBM98080.1 hypothetical protein Mp_1g10670 [Marchantia polymorpha subsp. ruderalis]|eukprot:PTQ45647.1 hypothetical protein MARPO_0014s0160 [Marchantia polymorpha]